MEPKGLIELLGSLTPDEWVRLRAPHVVESGPRGDSSRAIDRRLKAFGRSAAIALADVLPRSRTFGVTWGRTISHVVDSRADVWGSRTLDHPIHPGVIVMSSGGSDHAEIIAEALRCGLVNELIVDRKLAGALTRALLQSHSAEW